MMQISNSITEDKAEKIGCLLALDNDLTLKSLTMIYLDTALITAKLAMELSISSEMVNYFVNIIRHLQAFSNGCLVKKEGEDYTELYSQFEKRYKEGLRLPVTVGNKYHICTDIDNIREACRSESGIYIYSEERVSILELKRYALNRLMEMLNNIKYCTEGKFVNKYEECLGAMPALERTIKLLVYSINCCSNQEKEILPYDYFMIETEFNDIDSMIKHVCPSKMEDWG